MQRYGDIPRDRRLHGNSSTSAPGSIVADGGAVDYFASSRTSGGAVDYFASSRRAEAEDAGAANGRYSRFFVRNRPEEDERIVRNQRGNVKYFSRSDYVDDYLRELSMEQHNRKLRENGYTTLEKLKHAAIEDLEALGILKGHAIYIKRAVDQSEAWRRRCAAVAEDDSRSLKNYLQGLSLEKYASTLQNQGYTTVRKLRYATLAELEDIGVPSEVTARLIRSLRDLSLENAAHDQEQYDLNVWGVDFFEEGIRSKLIRRGDENKEDDVNDERCMDVYDNVVVKFAPAGLYMISLALNDRHDEGCKDHHANVKTKLERYDRGKLGFHETWTTLYRTWDYRYKTFIDSHVDCKPKTFQKLMVFLSEIASHKTWELHREENGIRVSKAVGMGRGPHEGHVYVPDDWMKETFKSVFLKHTLDGQQKLGYGGPGDKNESEEQLRARLQIESGPAWQDSDDWVKYEATNGRLNKHGKQDHRLLRNENYKKIENRLRTQEFLSNLIALYSHESNDPESWYHDKQELFYKLLKDAVIATLHSGATVLEGYEIQGVFHWSIIANWGEKVGTDINKKDTSHYRILIKPNANQRGVYSPMFTGMYPVEAPGVIYGAEHRDFDHDNAFWNRTYYPEEGAEPEDALAPPPPPPKKKSQRATPGKPKKVPTTKKAKLRARRRGNPKKKTGL